MKPCHASDLSHSCPAPTVALLLAALLSAGAASASTLEFASTSDVAAWTVAFTVSSVDNAPFPTGPFVSAANVTGRFSNGVQWIANDADGSNGGVGHWTQFVFRQSFDLTGFDPTSATLQFQWAADDSGEVFADRGHWVPKYSLNGGPLVPWGTGATYSFGPVVTLAEGFVVGLNHIDFFVQGNGQTDGLAVRPVAFTASAVPLPAAGMLLLGGLAVLTARRRLSALG